jgi:radical SAM-linked protein
MRVRATFAKTSAMRYTGHLDVQRAWERALRRGNLPLSYSKGFKPHPKLNLTAPLPLGFTGTHEMIDIWFDERLPLDVLKKIIASALPPGLQISTLTEVPIYGPKLPNLLTDAIYTVTLLKADSDLDARVSEFLKKDTIVLS